MERIYEKVFSLAKEKLDSGNIENDYEIFMNSNDWDALTKCKDPNWVLDRNYCPILINIGYLGCFLGCTLRRNDNLKSLIHTYRTCG